MVDQTGHRAILFRHGNIQGDEISIGFDDVIIIVGGGRWCLAEGTVVASSSMERRATDRRNLRLMFIK